MNRSSNVRKTMLISSLCVGVLTDTKQRFTNFSCFGDHDAAIVWAVITFLHCETSSLKKL